VITVYFLEKNKTGADGKQCLLSIVKSKLKFSVKSSKSYTVPFFQTFSNFQGADGHVIRTKPELILKVIYQNLSDNSRSPVLDWKIFFGKYQFFVIEISKTAYVSSKFAPKVDPHNLDLDFKTKLFNDHFC